MLKLITLNCFLSPWSPKRKQRLPFIVQALIGENSDIVLLEEVYFYQDANFLIKILRQAGFQDSFYSKTLLVLSKQPLSRRCYFDFPSNFRGDLIAYLFETGNRLYGKGFQAAQILWHNQLITIVNTHLLSSYGVDSGAYQNVKIRQLETIFHYLSPLKPERIILAGDFNFDFNSVSHRYATKEKFTDPFNNQAGHTFSTENLHRQHFWLKKLNQRIDHIFIKGFQANSYSTKIIFKKPCFINSRPLHISDHYGLALTLSSI